MTFLRRLALAALMIPSLAMGSLTFQPITAFAQDASPVVGGLDAVGGTLKLSNTDPRIIASRIINVVLGLLGVVMVSIILYAGFQWMTSGGDAEKVESSKVRLRNAVIGLIIILSAYALTTFVVRSLTEATGFGAGGDGGGPGGTGGGLGGGGSSNTFQLRSITPSGAVLLRNVEVRFIFSRDVEAGTASTSVTIVRASDGIPVAGAVMVSGSTVTFAPTDACPTPNESRLCFDADTEFIARVSTGLRSASGLPLVCGGFAPACEGRFTTGNLVDTAPPTGSIEYPLDGQSVSADDLIMVRTRATDDSGVSHVETSVDGAYIGTGASGSSSTATLVAEVEWDTAGLTVGTHSLSSRVYDLDSNTTDTPPITVVVRPLHCSNLIQDLDETDRDCGGVDCATCIGGSCTSGATCASTFCGPAGTCVEQPVITVVSPDDGRPGTLVSISGMNFGTTPGAVIFSPRIAANPPAACSASGSPIWSPNLIIVTVPDGAVDGPIEIENAAGLIDTTNDERGPVLANFDVNETAHPGLCAVRPDSGQAGTRIELVGVGLGDASDRVTFTDRAVSSFLSWADELIAMNVPVFAPANYAVKVFVGTAESNAVHFRLNERTTTAAPIIDALSPNAGPIGEYVTLQGRGFGGRTGRVFFRRGDGQGIADTDFPEQCSIAFWSDTSVTVKVPRTFRQGLGDTALTTGEWQVVLERQGPVESNALPFTVNNNAPRPGICAIQPSAGPVGTRVEIFGERFGAFASGQASFAGPSTSVRMTMTVPAADASRDWTSGRIVGVVPAGSRSGSVLVSQGTNVSNGMPFAVRNCNEDASICAVGQVCCRTGACSVGGACPASSPTAEFAWQLSTGLLPINPRVVEECSPARPASPSPWSGRTGGDHACVNTDLFLRFTTPIQRDSVSLSGATASFLVRKCTGSAANVCETASDPVPGTIFDFGVEGPADTGNGYILFRPTALWDGNATYQVILTTGIRSITNVPMLADYRFTFSTRASTDTCRVGTVNVVPRSATLSDIGATQGELAVPRSADDVCLNLRADAYDWRWNTSDGRAEVTNESVATTGGARRGLERQTATARAETGIAPVRVSAAMTQSGETIEGLGDLFVRLQPPRVVAYGPNCDQACLNAAAWARFNTDILPASVTTENIKLRRCVNENCLSYDLDPIPLDRASIRLMRTPESVSEALTYILLEPTGADRSTLLEVGRFYRITLRGGDLTGIRGGNGLPLAGLNDPEGFSWTFRVKTGDDARCAISRVNVTPGEKFETSVGARQAFVATPISAPDACSSEGSPLITDRTFAWSVEPSAIVSRLVNGGDGLAVAPGIVDTTSELPLGCSGRCLNLGSDGVDGRTASCGNGMIETTDAHYCVAGRTPFGTVCRLLSPGSRGAEECDDATTACGTTCKWNPVAVGGSCGNSVVNSGEQCDLGPEGGHGCSTECQLLGSRVGGSTCGNGDVAAGEACDDANTVSGDGCSADCLHEGSVRVHALCGNGRFEPGESCERPAAGAAFPAGCNQTTCLNEGTAPPMCGNAATNPGEDCDDGNLMNDDGCSARCLKEGSSTSYDAASFCGDGVRGRGEMCESTGGDSRPDALQLAEIVGEGEPDAEGRMSSQVIADYDTKRGQSTYGLQCGFREESSCSGGNGVDARGCCAPRPTLGSHEPTSGETGVCRNVSLSATFDVRMDEGTVQTNFVIAREVVGDVCPAGSERVASIEEYDPTPGFRGWVNRTWSRLMSWFRPQTAEAAWCAGSVRGSLSFQPFERGTKADFTLERALEGSTRYQVLFRGDMDLSNNGDVNNRVGIKSSRGVVSNGNILWDFMTGLRLCTVTAISVRDANVDSPNLFTRADEGHLYTADVISLQDGRRVALSPVTEYEWAWEPWVTSNRDVLGIDSSVSFGGHGLANVKVMVPPMGGSSFVEAGIRIVRDDIGVPSSTGRIIKGSQTAQVLLCENPWPARGSSPFSETSGHPSLGILSGDWGVLRSLRSIGPWFNFSTLYCRDAGERGIAGDLPELQAQAVAVSDADLSLGILRQYLFTFGDAYPSLRGDGIGIRVATNPLHLSPRAWYASRGFTGEPEALTVDGYEAVKAGTTWYIGGTNTADATSAPVYSQIYIISYNPDAKQETKSIVGQLVGNFTLNVNLQSGSSNSCTYAGSDWHPLGQLVRDADGQVVSCTADWECLAKDRNTRCSSFKSKVQRDSKRIVDFQFMTDSLESSHERSGSYPQLQAGTFVPTMSTSRWPSWSSQLQGETGVAFPSDPVNRFLSCGFCSGSGSPCQDNSECSAGQTCAAATGRAGVEPSTCWNPTSRQYQCPQLTSGVSESVSRLYQYRSVNAGTRYELSTELEGAAATRYDPPLLTEIKKCSNLDVICTDRDTNGDGNADDCEVINTLTRAVVSSGTCNATGGTWRYNAVCTSSVYGAGAGVCGDGIIGSGEVCEIGDTNPEVCHVPGTPAGAGDNGTQLRICNDCGSNPTTAWVDGPATRCVLTLQCGNGRVDAGETCDDGALNGSYGHCSRSCGGYDSFCGDSRMSPGETCDLGTNNGDYCRFDCDAATSCNLSCTGPGPRCGDGEVNGDDECDGNAERTTSAICVGGSNINGLCTSNSDCPGVENGCGPAGSALVSCAGVTARRCSNGTHPACAVDSDCGVGNRCLTYPTSHTRACRDYGTPLPTVPGNWCKWKPWSACEPTSYCGDGIVDAGENCDDGNASNNDACTNACRSNVCGDSFYYSGVEECDLGVDNGRRTCTADYGSSCLDCSSSCRQVASSGGYCGNDVREGSEQCDGTQGLGTCSGDSTRSCVATTDCAPGQTCNSISCRSLGFDYAQSMTCQNYAFVRDGGRVVCTSREICWLSLDALLTTGVLIPAGSVTTTLAEAPRVCTPGTIRDTLSCASSCSLAGCARCGDSPGTGTITGQVLDAVNYVYPVPNARVTLYNRGVPVTGGQTVTDNNGRFTINTLDNNSACVSYRIVVDFYQDNPCTGPGRPVGMSCNGLDWDDAILGTSDESVNGGYWPYESATFGVSTFQSKGLNSDTDKIYLAPRVGVDETVAVATFRESNTTLLPYLELPTDQAYKADNTTPAPEDMVLCSLGAKDGHEPNYDYDPKVCSGAHPASDAMCTATARGGTTSGSGVCFNGNCIYPMCQRTLFWNAQGNQNLSVTPHSEIVCRNVSGSSVSAGCYTARAAPYVARFKKGPWNGSGYYSYWLVDQSSGAAPPSWQYFNAVSATVTVVTHDRIYKVTPPTTPPTCTPPLTAPIPNSQRPITLFPGPPAWVAPAWCGNIATESTNGVGKYWLVFQENASTGDIVLNNQLLCRNSSVPNEPSNFDVTSPLPYPLPWPLIWSDCHYAVPR